jgi:hypothetical protein
MRRAGRLAIVMVAIIGGFVVAMTAAYSIPQDRIIANAKRSLPILEHEVASHTPFVDDASYRLAVGTDAIMIDIAIARAGDSPIIAALAGYKGPASGGVPALAMTLAGEKDQSNPYAYYWHGNQVFLRPALALVDYGELRYVNLLLFSALAVAAAIGAAGVAGRPVALALVASLVLTGFFIVPLSLHFSSMAYLMLVSVIIVCRLVRSGHLGHYDLEVFLAIGAATAFFDMMTTPLLTLGMPLVLVLVAGDLPEGGIPRRIWVAARLALVWGVGYAVAWSAKWLIGTLALRRPVLSAAIDQVAFRVGTGRGTPVALEALRRNILNVMPLVRADSMTAGAIFLLLALLVVVALIWAMVKFPVRGMAARRAWPLLATAALPYVWFIAVSNHSWYHHWFTYRIQAVTIFALLSFAVASIDWPSVRLGLPLRTRSRVDRQSGDS